MVKLRESKSDNTKADSGERFPALDALRGVLLLLMISHGFGLRQMLNQQQWSWITNQWAHREWAGCSLWDLLQPGMLFVVGVGMTFSYANRQGRGQGWPIQFIHALARAGILLALGIYLDAYLQNRSLLDLRVLLDFRGDLQQVALAYLLAFFLLPLGLPVHGVTVGFLLIGHTAAYVIYALAGGYDLWSPSHNVGIAFDQMLHLGPHRERYVVLNVIPATAIVMIGVCVGGLIRTGLTPGVKVVIMTACSLAGILFGWLLSGGDGWIDSSWYALLPMIKRLGTLTFVIMSVGWVMLLFIYFYTLMEGFLLQSWALPIMLIGRNSLFLYLTYHLFRDWAARSARLVLPESPALLLTLQPLFIDLIVLAVFWLFCFWLYRRRIFFKV